MLTPKREAAEARLNNKRMRLPNPTEEDFEEIDVQAEVQPPRQIKTPSAPTLEEKEEHELTGHAVYRDWCKHCIAGKGQGQRHLIQSRDEENEVLLVACDYAFMGEEDKCLPILISKDKRYQSIHASFVDAKGATDYAVKYLANVYKLIGSQKILGWTDGEPAIKKLKKKAAEAAEIEMVPREPTPGNHQSNGFIENAVREVKRQTRVVRSDLEEKLGFRLDDNDPVLRWLPRYAADVISRYRKGVDGRTPERRRTGRAWNRPTIRFGERAYFKPVGEYSGSTYQPKMIEGRYLGHHSRTGACIAITSNGVIHASGIRRLPDDQKWVKDGWSDLKGLPWDTAPRKPREPKDQGEDLPIATGEEAKPLNLPRVAEPQAKEKETRGFYVLKSDIKRYQATDGCPGCAMVIITGKTHAPDGSMYPHNDTCRERIFQKVLADTDRNERAVQYQKKLRKAEIEKAKRERPEENAAEAAGDSRKKVRAKPKTQATKRAAETAEPAENKDGEVQVVSQQGGSSGSGQPAKRMHIEDLVNTVPKADAGTAQAGETQPSDVAMDAEDTSKIQGKKRSAETQKTPQDLDDIDALEEIKQVILEINQLTIAGLYDSLKAEQYPETKQAIEAQFRRHREDVSADDLNEITQLALDIGAIDLKEVYSSETFTERAQDFGLRPGIAVDLQSGWNLDDAEHVEQIEYLLKEENPMFLIGSPSCELFEGLAKKSRQSKLDEESEETRHLRVACELYSKQSKKGGRFLHEHPEGAESWKSKEIQEVRNLSGKLDEQSNPIEIHEVEGPDCQWGLKATKRPTKQKECIKGKTRWLTNCPKLAKLLREITKSANLRASIWRRQVQLMNGQTKGIQCYAPEVLKAVLQTAKTEMMETGELDQLSSVTAGPSPHEPVWFEDQHVEEDYEDYFDTVNGGFLQPALVKAARQEELMWVDSQKIFNEELISYEEARSRMGGVAPISVKWVDTNKGDDKKTQYRSRLVAREIKKMKKADQQLEVKDLFSAMPPLEALKILVSLLITEEEGVNNDDKHLALFDISRAHFYGKPTRELYVILPKELNPEGKHGGRACAKLNQTMYGTQDASKIWQDTYKALLTEKGFQTGISNAAVFRGNKGEKALVHGDDFLILASQKCIDEFEGILRERFKLKKEWQIGFGENEQKSGRVLNRIISLETRPKKAVIEPDARHAQLIVKELGLENAKAVETPAEKLSAERQLADAKAPAVSKTEEKIYRSVTMRASYLAQDCPDLSETVKTLARYMKEPNEAHFGRLKRLGRFLKKYSLLRNVMYPQRLPKRLMS